MRKAQKERVCNFLAFVKQAQKKIKQNIEQENLLLLLGILEDCQSGINIITNWIKQTEGEDFSVIPLLEKYCKLSSEISNALVEIFEHKSNSINYIEISENKNSVRDLNKRNQKQDYFLTITEMMKKQNQVLEQIEMMIRDITIKKQVVFLPYKASMWDSLESVWKAAKEDKNCETYVIPIPYFDRTAEGTFGEIHYEGDLYPKDVPITHYKEFDLKEQQPDVIFIHNPYDAYNRVTSVHPDFYSDKLKTYTEKLVYIPYFILQEIAPENETAVEQIAHFCKVPAVLNADRVIVQSEQMKQVYVKVLTQWMGEHTRSQWEEKILGLGSPKEDKILNTKKEDLDIPKEWLSVIEKEDGTWKKIIFYNTSLSTFLQYSEEYLQKLKDALNVFLEQKEHIALLWRPHPLMQITIASMHPKFQEEYQTIVQQYQSEKWGIYDDTPDLDRAIRLADAYYGDPSSVVQLCQKVGMPIMIQNVEIRYEE